MMAVTDTTTVKKRKRVEEDTAVKRKDGHRQKRKRQKRKRQLENDSADHLSVALQISMDNIDSVVNDGSEPQQELNENKMIVTTANFSRCKSQMIPIRALLQQSNVRKWNRKRS